MSNRPDFVSMELHTIFSITAALQVHLIFNNTCCSMACQERKRANIVPVFKKGKWDDPSDFKPLGLT